MKKKIEYLTPKQLRTKFMLSLSRIYTLLNDPVDPIPHHRIGTSYRIIVDELDDWLKRHHKIMGKER